MAGFDVLGNVILLTPPRHAERILEQIPAQVDLDQGWAGGAHRLPNGAGLVYKVLGVESRQVRARVHPTVRSLAGSG
jgi:urease accessory protein